jgi:hypothetical protein
LVMRHRGDMYWVSGVGSNSDFENVGTMTLDGLYYNFSYVSNENESYFNYSSPDMDVSRWVLYSDGSLSDNPKLIFVRSGMCFGYSSDRGCVEQNAPTLAGIAIKSSREDTVIFLQWHHLVWMRIRASVLVIVGLNAGVIVPVLVLIRLPIIKLDAGSQINL